MDTHKRTAYITLTIMGMVLLVGVGIVATIYIRQYQRDHAPDLARSEAGESVVYRDMQGNEVSLLSYTGKPLVVNAWATWSPFSKGELEGLSQLKKEFGDKIEILAINRKETAATINAYLESIGSTEGVTFIQDDQDAFFNSVTGYAMPETIIYDREGNEVSHVRGTMTKDEMRNGIEAALAKED